MPDLFIPPFSYDNHLTYKIKEDDTPESVAVKLGIDLYILRSYHNMRCPYEDCIGPTFPQHLKFLILQSQEEKQIKESYREPIHFYTTNFKLPFRPAQLNKKYLAMYTIENGTKRNSIKEEVNVKWLSTYQDNYFFIEIDRKELFVDDLEEKSMADELAAITAKVFYPLEIVVDTNGKLAAIHNFNAIRDRWPELKKKVLKEFTGSAVEERLKVFESKLADNVVISKAFLNDWFLKAFFNGLNIEYKKTLTIENTIKFPVSQKIGEVEFKVDQTILPTVDQYNLVNITQKGILVDNRSKEDFENNLLFPYHNLEDDESKKLEGTYQAHYFLDPNMNTIDSLFLECEMKLDIPQKVTIVISDLKERGKLIIDSKIDLYVPQESKPERDMELFWMIIGIIVLVIGAVYGIFKFYIQK